MALINYTALRNIMAGHTISTDYDLTVQGHLSSDFQRIVEENFTDSGRSFQSFTRLDVFWNFDSRPLLRNSSDYNQMKEFLYSVMWGEIFELTPYTGDTVRNAVLTGNWSESRVSNSNYFRFQFKVKEV